MNQIKREENGFYIEENGEKLANIEFVTSGENNDILIITHTFVSDQLRGQGVGNDLVKKVVEFAREEKKLIRPQCSFAKKVMDNTKEYQDQLA
ncbi:GNAT family N-acetyltransferase [Peribacillus sp. SCS-155]|uniref:GNAT family N-acetyltransferase n=1 Tax=Peribacillus sedimenti TaxID=3115297 RepID=UPI003906C7F5